MQWCQWVVKWESRHFFLDKLPLRHQRKPRKLPMPFGIVCLIGSKNTVQPIPESVIQRKGVLATLSLSGKDQENLILTYSPIRLATGYVASTVQLKFGGRATGRTHASILWRWRYLQRCQRCQRCREDGQVHSCLVFTRQEAYLFVFIGFFYHVERHPRTKWFRPCRPGSAVWLRLKDVSQVPSHASQQHFQRIVESSEMSVVKFIPQLFKNLSNTVFFKSGLSVARFVSCTD